MADLEYPVAVCALSEDDGGGYMAFAVDLKGCMADGGTPEEAIASIRDAILEWIDEATRLGRPVPSPGASIESAQKEQKQLIEVLLEQDKLIASQADAYDGLRKEAAKLRDQLRALSTHRQREENDPDWVNKGALFAGLVPARRPRNGDVSH